MTSVQNPRLLLNGSKKHRNLPLFPQWTEVFSALFSGRLNRATCLPVGKVCYTRACSILQFLPLIPLLLLFSCGIFQEEQNIPPVTHPQPDTSTTEQPEKPPVSPEDTLQLKEKYEVAVLLPLHLDTAYWQKSGVPAQSLLGLEFYEGMQLAFEDLRKKGLNMNVYVQDTRNSPAETQEIIENLRFKPLDLIIGPVHNQNIKVAAKHAKRNKIYMVSPLSPSDKVVQDNPYYIIANATLAAHFSALADFVARKFNNQNIVVLGHYGEKERIEQIKAILQSSGKIDSVAVATLSSTEPEHATIRSYLSKEKENIVLIPSFKEAFVASVLFQLNNIRGDSIYVIKVLGMPTWDRYNSLRADHLHNLKVHITQSFLIEEQKPAIKAFIKRYYNKYKTLPSQYAYEGYDVTYTFGMLLHKYGKSFPYFLEGREYKGLHQNYGFAASKNAEGQYNYIENRNVHIVKFENFEMKKVE